MKKFQIFLCLLMASVSGVMAQIPNGVPSVNISLIAPMALATNGPQMIAALGGLTNIAGNGNALTNITPVAYANQYGQNQFGEFRGIGNQGLYTNAQVSGVDFVYGGQYNVAANITNGIWDLGNNFTSGENVGWTNTSGISYTVLANTFGFVSITNWPAYSYPVAETLLAGGVSRYTVNVTCTNSTWFYIEALNGQPSTIGGISITSGAQGVSLGVDGNGNPNLAVNGNEIIQVNGNNTSLSLPNGNKILSMNTSGGGIVFGNGLGGSSGAVIGADGTVVGNGLVVTNSTSAANPGFIAIATNKAPGFFWAAAPSGGGGGFTPSANQTNVLNYGLTNNQLGAVNLATNSTLTTSNLNLLGVATGNGAGVTNVLASSLNGTLALNSLPIIQPSAILALGDSFTYATPGAASYEYPQLIATNLGIQGNVSDLAINGAQAADMGWLQVYPAQNPSNNFAPLQTMLIGVNDANFKGVGAYEAIFNECQQAAISWLTIPSQSKIFGQNPVVTTTGTWHNSTFITPNSNIGIYTTNQNSTASFPITTAGKPIDVWYQIQDVCNAVATWSLDGGPTNGFNGFGPVPIATLNAVSQSIALLRIPAAAGAHTLLFNLITPTTTTNFLSIFAVGTPSTNNYIQSPKLLVGGVAMQSNNANASVTAQYNSDVISNVNLLGPTNDGLQVYFVDVRKYLSSTLDYTNSLHPNDSGQRHLQDAFEGVVPLAAGAVQANVFFLNTTNKVTVNANQYLAGPTSVGTYPQTYSSGNLFFRDAALADGSINDGFQNMFIKVNTYQGTANPNYCINPTNDAVQFGVDYGVGSKTNFIIQHAGATSGIIGSFTNVLVVDLTSGNETITGGYTGNSLTVHSNAFSIFNLTNGLTLFDNILGSSNGVPIMVQYLGSGTPPVITYIGAAQGGIIP